MKPLSLRACCPLLRAISKETGTDEDFYLWSDFIV